MRSSNAIFECDHARIRKSHYRNRANGSDLIELEAVEVIVLNCSAYKVRHLDSGMIGRIWGLESEPSKKNRSADINKKKKILASRKCWITFTSLKFKSQKGKSKRKFSREQVVPIVANALRNQLLWIFKKRWTSPEFFKVFACRSHWDKRIKCALCFRIRGVTEA